MARRSIWLGALLTSVLFNFGNILVGLYLGRATATATYGAAGSLVVVLLWLDFFAASMFLFGAEFTQVHAKRYGGLPSRQKREPEEGPSRRAEASWSPSGSADYAAASNVYKTLISAADLSERLALPGVVVVDCRFARRQHGRRARLCDGPCPERDLRAPRARPLGVDRAGRDGAPSLPNPEGLAQKLGAWGVDEHAARRVRRRRRRHGRANSGGSHVGWATTRSRCSTAATRRGSRRARWSSTAYRLQKRAIFDQRCETSSSPTQARSTELGLPLIVASSTRAPKSVIEATSSPSTASPDTSRARARSPFGEPRERPVQEGSRAARALRGGARRRRGRARHRVLRKRSHGLSHPASGTPRRPAGHAALPGIVERMDRQSLAPGRPRRMSANVT